MKIKHIITAMAFALSLSINITAQSPATGTINGHEYVDLGLSVLWATCNVGAVNPYNPGDHFAWGEVKTKANYNSSKSETYGKSQYVFRDAATYNWGNSWRMPTKAECQELVDNCTWQWTAIGDHKGHRVTSKKNGNSIFLPAAGYSYNTMTFIGVEWGYYWSSSPYESSSNGAYSLNAGSGGHGIGWDGRYNGESIRPVADKIE